MVEGSDTYNALCKPAKFCDAKNNIAWRIDPSDEISLENWIVKYDLVCANPFLISLFGMMFFTGFTVGSLFIPNLSDKYGRKWFFVASILVQALTNVVIFMLPGQERRYVHMIIALMFVHGICSSCRITIGFCMQSDFSPTAYNSAISSFWNI